MASEVARLVAHVEVKTQEATADLRALESSLTRAGRVAETQTSAISKAGGGLGAPFRSASAEISTSFQRAATATRPLQTAVEGVRTAAAGMDAPVRTATAGITTGLQQAGAAARTAQADFTRVGQSSSGMGSAFSAITSQLGGMVAGLGAAGAAATAFGVAMKTIGTAANFEQSLANLKAATGATTEQMQAVRAEAIGIGKDTSRSAGEATAAMTELLKAGMSVEKVIGGAARVTVNLAEATGIAMEEAATLISNSVNTFKREGIEAAGAAEVLARAAGASAIDVGDLGQSLSAVGPIAASAGLKMDDFARAMGIAGNNAIKGSDAGTSLKAMLSGLTPNSDKAADAMRDLGISVFDASGNFKPMREIVQQLTAAFGPLNEQQRATYGNLIFGSDGVRMLNVLLKEGVKGWDDFGDAMSKAPTIAEQSATRMDTLKGSIELFKGELDTLAISIGMTAIPALTKFLELLTRAAEEVGPATEEARKGFGFLIDIMGKFGSAVSELESRIPDGGGKSKSFMDMLQEDAKKRTPVGFLELMSNIRDSIDPAIRLQAAMEKLGPQWRTNVVEAQNLTAALDTMKTAGKSNEEIVAALVLRHTELGRLLAQETDITPRWKALSGAMAETETIAKGLGVTILMGADAQGRFQSVVQGATAAVQQQATSITTSSATIAAAAPMLNIFGAAIAEIIKKATDAKTKVLDVAEAFKGAFGFIDQLAGQMTGVEGTLDRQTKSLQAMASASRAAFSSQSVESIATWTARAHEMADAAGLAAGPTAALHREIDLVAKQGPVGAAALERLNAAADKASAPMQDASKASRDYAGAVAAAGKESMGLTGTLEGIRDAIRDFVTEFSIAMGRIPPSVREAMKQVEGVVTIDLSKPGAEAALSFLGGFKDKQIIITNGAQEVARSVNGVLKVDTSQAGAETVTSYAKGIQVSTGLAYQAAVIVGREVTKGFDGTVAQPPGEAAGAKFATGIRSTAQAAATASAIVAAGAVGGFKGQEGAAAAAGINVAAAFARGIEGGRLAAMNAAVGLATSAMGALRGALEIASPSRVAIEAGEEVGEGFAIGLQKSESIVTDATKFITEPVRRALSDFEKLGPEMAIGALASTLASAGGGAALLRQWQQQVAALDVQIGEFRRRLAGVDPESDYAKKLNEVVKALENQKAPLEANISLLNTQQKAIEANKTALDGFSERLSAIAQSRENTTLYGALGAGLLDGLQKALKEGTPAAGAAVADGLEKMLSDARFQALPHAHALGGWLQDTIAAALGDPSETNIQVAVNLLQTIGDEFRKAGALLPENFAAGFDKAWSKHEWSERLGGLSDEYQKMTDAIAKGGEGALEATIALSVEARKELGKLPEFLRGELGTAYKTAMDAFIADPTEAAAQRVGEAAARIHSSIGLIPKDFAKLDVAAQSAVRSVVDAVQAGTFAAEAARDEISRIADEAQKRAEQAKKVLEEIRALEASNPKGITGYSTAINNVVGRAGEGAPDVSVSSQDLGGGVQRISVQGPGGTSTSYSLPTGMLGAYGGNMAAAIRDIEAGYGTRGTWVPTPSTPAAVVSSPTTAQPAAAGGGVTLTINQYGVRDQGDSRRLWDDELWRLKLDLATR